MKKSKYRAGQFRTKKGGGGGMSELRNVTFQSRWKSDEKKFGNIIHNLCEVSRNRELTAHETIVTRKITLLKFLHLPQRTFSTVNSYDKIF